MLEAFPDRALASTRGQEGFGGAHGADAELRGNRQLLRVLARRVRTSTNAACAPRGEQSGAAFRFPQTDLERARYSRGEPLPVSLRKRLEDASGADLSAIRLHRTNVSARAAESISAAAYADGLDIHFAAGQFDVESWAGRRLVAHEVAHAIQLGGSRPDLRRVANRESIAERQADGFAASALESRPSRYLPSSFPPLDARPVGIQRCLEERHRRVLEQHGVSVQRIPPGSERRVATALDALNAALEQGRGRLAPMPPSVRGVEIRPEVETRGGRPIYEGTVVHIEAHDFVAVLRQSTRGRQRRQELRIYLPSGEVVYGAVTERLPVTELTLEPPAPTPLAPSPRRERSPRQRSGRRRREPPAPRREPPRSPTEQERRARFVLEMIERVERAVRGLVEDVDENGLTTALRARFNEMWPVGGGARVNTGFGATFAVPIYAGVDGDVIVDRVSADVVEITRVTTLDIGVDTGIGVGAQVNLGRRVGVQARAEARAGGGHRARLYERYAFPIGTDEEFLSFLAVLGGGTTQTMGALASLSSPEAAALNPELYLQERTLRYGLYGDASAQASAGFTAGSQRARRDLRTGEEVRNEQDEPVTEERRGGRQAPWMNTEAPPRNEVRDADEHGNTAPLVFDLIRGVAAQIGVGLEAGVEVGVVPESRSERSRRTQPGQRLESPRFYEVSFTMQGAVAARATWDLPGPLPIPIELLNRNPGIGVRLTVTVQDAPGRRVREITNPRVHLVLSQGDVYRPTGAASETVVDFDSARRILLSNVSHRQRWTRSILDFDLLVPFVRRRIDRQLRARGFSNAARAGRTSSSPVAAELQVDFELRFDPDRVLQVIERWGEAVFAAMRQQGVTPTLEQLLADTMAWFQTGQPPAYVARSDELLNALLRVVQLRRLRIVADVGLGVQTDLRAAFGAKLRLQGRGEGALRFTFDLMQGEDALTAEEAVPLVRELMSGAERDIEAFLSRLPRR